MIRKRFMMLLSLCSCLWAGAQTLHVSGTCADASPEGMKIYLTPMDRTAGKAEPLVLSGNSFTGDVSVAADGFYTLSGVYQGAQLLLPLYLPDPVRKYHMELRLKGAAPGVKLDADNEALSAFNEVLYTRGRAFWENGRSMKPEALLAHLRGYVAAADSIIRRYGCTGPVACYLSLWAYTSAANDYQGIPHLSGAKLSDLPFTKSDFLKDPVTMLDTPLAAYFPVATWLVVESLPAGTLGERLAALHSRYTCEVVRSTATAALVDAFVSRFDYKNNFDTGLAELEAAARTYGLDPSVVEGFRKRRASVEGAAFPANIKLVDAQGNAVSLDQFKGSYLYIDLWASWCGPCCKEVPHLQKLEADLANKDVKFISISIDKNEAAWKAKMKALNMHGHQYLNQDNKLAEALNVRGIPFFIIYDKEGKLHTYNAPRPSHPALKELLESLH